MAVYLINPLGLVIKPMDAAHAERLLSTRAGWKIDPATGEHKPLGFRVATGEEVRLHLEREKAAAEKQRKQNQAILADSNRIVLD